MTTSKTIAGLIGPTLIAIGATILLNLSTWPVLLEQFSHDSALIYVSGLLLFVAGLAIVRAHNRWTVGWPMLVTGLGWLAVLGGLLRMLFPMQFGQLALGLAPRTGVLSAVAAVLLVVGGFLSFKAYRRE